MELEGEEEILKIALIQEERLHPYSCGISIRSHFLTNGLPVNTAAILLLHSGFAPLSCSFMS